MKSFFKTFTVLITILSTLVFHNAAYALVSQADIEAVDKGGEFYQQGCNTNEAANGQAKFQLSMIGDSLLVGAYSAGLNEKVNAKQYVLADPENKWPSGKVSRNTQEGIDIIKSNSQSIKNSGAILIELGTNDKLGLIQNDGERIEEVIKAIKDTQTSGKVYWVIPYNSTMSETENTSVAEMLNSKAQSLQFTTLDWPSEVKKNNYVLEGGVHPGANYGAYADFLVNNVTNTSKGLSVQGACRCNSLTGNGTLPDSIPQPYHDIFIAAASQFNVEPATIATLKLMESSSNYPEIGADGSGGTWGFKSESVGGAWEAEYLAPGSPNVGKIGSAGPFQFLFSSWKSQSWAIENDGNKDGRYDAENVIDAAYAAARFISELGGTKGASQEQLTLAFAKYNGGPATTAPSAFEYGRRAYERYQDIITQGGTSIQGTGGSTSCNKGQGVSADGFQFPLNTTKALLKEGNGQGLVWDCAKNADACLNDPTYQSHGYAAADIGALTGTPVLAARPGQVTWGDSADCKLNCSITVQADDGLFYLYTHMGAGTIKVSMGQKVVAGDVIGAVGTAADAQTSPHLHFDIRSESATCVRGDVEPKCAEVMKDPRPALVASYNNLPAQ